MGADATKVTTAKPAIGGAISRAPLGTALPESAVAALNEAFKSLGYVSEDGMTNGNTITTEDIKAWGGDVVSSSQTEKKDTFKFKLIEAKNQDVLKAVFGQDNVTVITVDDHEEIKIAVNSDEQEDASWVADTILKGKSKKRIVIPNAKITEVAEIVYKDNEPIGYEVTLTAVPDENGNSHYEYIY